jgi:flagellar basal body P-ring formation protein FlgA
MKTIEREMRTDWVKLMNKVKKLHVALVAIAGFAIGLATILLTNSTMAADIAMRAVATPSGTMVRLGDVAEISGDNKQETQRLAAMPLMAAPAPGTDRYLRMREVQDLLAAHGENMDQLRFKGELVVAIGSQEAAEKPVVGSVTSDARAARHTAWNSGSATVAATASTPDSNSGELRDELSRRVIEYLDFASGASAAWRVKLNVPGQQLTMLPADSSTWTISGGTAPWTGKQRFLVSFAGAQHADSFTVPVDVSLPMPVVVAIRPLERGTVVTAADVEIQQRDTAPVGSARSCPLSSVEKLVGMEATRTIQIGDVIMSDSVQPPVLVKRGDSVTVYARGGGIQVRTIARARENGSLGQPVQLESLETHKSYDAVVTGTREAVVFAGSGPPLTETASERGNVLRR